MFDCAFCKPATEKWCSKNDLVAVFEDRYPVTNGHLLIAPSRHVANIFDVTADELCAIWWAIQEAKKALSAWDKNISGFNVGVNIGKSSGQTINHAHVHLIPRRVGDMNDPKGGVRGVIPCKQKYDVEVPT